MSWGCKNAEGKAEDEDTEVPDSQCLAAVWMWVRDCNARLGEPAGIEKENQVDIRQPLSPGRGDLKLEKSSKDWYCEEVL